MLGVVDRSQSQQSSWCDRGFTLVELVMVVAILAIMSAFAAPAFKTWVANTKTRTVAESLQNGIRIAQIEAIKRGVQVQFVLTNDAPVAKNVTASTTGKNWVIQSMDRAAPSTADEFLQGAPLAAVSSASLVSGPAKLTFNSMGRMILPTSTATFSVTNSSVSDGRSLNLTVSLAGKVRMCDPDKTLSSSSPDGC